MTKTVNTDRVFAATRAHRTMVAKMAATFVNPVARMALEHALSLYDAELVGAPSKAAKVPADRKLAAIRACRTRVERAMKGTRGNARKALVAKIEAYDAMLAA